MISDNRQTEEIQQATARSRARMIAEQLAADRWSVMKPADADGANYWGRLTLQHGGRSAAADEPQPQIVISWGNHTGAGKFRVSPIWPRDRDNHTWQPGRSGAGVDSINVGQQVPAKRAAADIRRRLADRYLDQWPAMLAQMLAYEARQDQAEELAAELAELAGRRSADMRDKHRGNRMPTDFHGQGANLGRIQVNSRAETDIELRSLPPQLAKDILVLVAETLAELREAREAGELADS